jgi:hypothetical protein
MVFFQSLTGHNWCRQGVVFRNRHQAANLILERNTNVLITDIVAAVVVVLAAAVSVAVAVVAAVAVGITVLVVIMVIIVVLSCVHNQ